MAGLEVLVLAPAIMFVASLIYFTFGFGNALVAMPFLSTLIGVRGAAPLVALCSPLIAGVILARHRRALDLRSVADLLGSSLLGVPVGLFALRGLDESVTKTVLALVLIGFAAYRLRGSSPGGVIDRRWAYPFGFAAGVLGALYNTNGPPVIVYGALRRWPPERFRASLQGFFLPSSFVIMLGHALGGLWTRQVLQLFALRLPLVVLSIFLGERLARRISARAFDRYVHYALIVIGLVLLGEALF